MAYKKIIVFSVPFSGHLNILKEFIHSYEREIQFKLVITGWNNITANVTHLCSETSTLAKTDLHETDPALWTLPRVCDLLEDSIEITKEFNPDLILYDFFSLEGLFVGQILNIPFWCSIPAMIGPFVNQQYLHKKLSSPENQRSIKQLQEKFHISIKQPEIEMISDGLHLPGKHNIIWSYPTLTPSDFLKNRKKLPYTFVGRINTREKHKKNKTPLVYFSLGTVVLNNLWNQQKHLRPLMKKFIAHIAHLSKNKNVKLIFVTQGKKILQKYPQNWEVLTIANQVKVLTEADIFITHGGSNSFHEAVLQKVPMIVIPFFGDQPLIGTQVEKLGIGINLGTDTNIDTKKSKQFLNKNLATRLDKAISDILSDTTYKINYQKIQLTSTSLRDLLNLFPNT